MGWFQQHLNWTWVFAYVIWIPLNASESGLVGLVAAIFLLLVSGWVIKQKGRSLWWILLAIIFSPLWLKSKKETTTIERLSKLAQTPITELSREELLTLKEKYFTDEAAFVIDDELTSRAKEAEEG